VSTTGNDGSEQGVSRSSEYKLLAISSYQKKNCWKRAVEAARSKLSFITSQVKDIEHDIKMIFDEATLFDDKDDKEQK
jgi:hypothetical protein